MKLLHAELLFEILSMFPTIISPLSACNKAEFNFLLIDTELLFIYLFFCKQFGLLFVFPISGQQYNQVISTPLWALRGLIRLWKAICHCRGWTLSLTNIFNKYCCRTGIILLSMQQHVICSSSVNPLFNTSAIIHVTRKHC